MKTEQEFKMEWARKLRQPGNLPSLAPEAYMKQVEQVNIKEMNIPTSVGDSKCYLMEAKEGKKNDGLYINIHGGGFVQKHNQWDEALCAEIALTLNCLVLDIDYRLAPEYPFPIPVKECYEVYRWVIQHSKDLQVNTDKIIIGGNSAGGTLAVDCCLKASEEKIKMPAMLVIIYPPSDAVYNKEKIDFLNPDIDLSDLSMRGKIYNYLYAGDAANIGEGVSKNLKAASNEADDESSYMDFSSIAYVDLNAATNQQIENFPETLIMTAGKDVLCNGGERFAGKLIQAGVPVTVRRFKESGHGFFVRCLSTEWQEAHEFMYANIRRKF